MASKKKKDGRGRPDLGERKQITGNIPMTMYEDLKGYMKATLYTPQQVVNIAIKDLLEKENAKVTEGKKQLSDEGQ